MKTRSTGGPGWSFDPAGSSAMERPGNPKASSSQAVRLAVENRGSGKVVTVLRNLPLSKDRLEGLAHSLKKACGTGGTVKDDVIELQGRRIDQVRDWLTQKGFSVRG